CAYSEYVFEESNWPDFSKEIYEEILKEFKTRDRRYGAVLKQ
ncbi:undecaprenyl diphosphate synthase family protein, partial [Amylibacter sp.]|nr:undecaprenyl diphosphate synthase family protein [Amylibacter sp.]